MLRTMLLATCCALPIVSAWQPAHAQYGGRAAAIGAGAGLLGGLLGGVIANQQQQAAQAQAAAQAAAQQQYEMQRQAAYAQARADAAARREEYDRQQAAIHQQQLARARHDAEVRAVAAKAAADKAEADREAQAARDQAERQAQLAKDEADRQADALRQQAALEQAKREADQLMAAQTIAEEASSNHCREPAFAKVVLENFNKFKVLNRLDKQVIDIEHLTTDKYNEKTTAMVCHGTFLFDDGAEVAGDFEIRKNVAGNLISLWSPDAIDGGRAHLIALNAGPVHDLQAIGGPGGPPAPRMIVIPASDDASAPAPSAPAMLQPVADGPKS